MSTCHPRRVTRKSAERTLAGLAHGSPRRNEPVAGPLLAFVMLPLDPETAGERQALSALPTARQEPIVVRRTGKLGRRFRQLVTIKIAVAAAVLAASGVAVAAGSGGLARAVSGGTERSASRPPAAEHAPGPPGQSASRSTSHGTAPLGPSPSPDASTEALTANCLEFEALSSDGRGTALRGKAFANLVHAAHGRSRISTFCAVLLSGGSPGPHALSGSSGASSHPTPPSHPAHPSHPVGAHGIVASTIDVTGLTDVLHVPRGHGMSGGPGR